MAPKVRAPQQESTSLGPDVADGQLVFVSFLQSYKVREGLNDARRMGEKYAMPGREVVIPVCRLPVTGMSRHMLFPTQTGINKRTTLPLHHRSRRRCDARPKCNAKVRIGKHITDMYLYL